VRKHQQVIAIWERQNSPGQKQRRVEDVDLFLAQSGSFGAKDAAASYFQVVNVLAIRRGNDIETRSDAIGLSAEGGDGPTFVATLEFPVIDLGSVAGEDCDAGRTAGATDSSSLYLLERNSRVHNFQNQSEASSVLWVRCTNPLSSGPGSGEIIFWRNVAAGSECLRSR
jgi:hypothetical protein